MLEDSKIRFLVAALLFVSHTSCAPPEHVSLDMSDRDPGEQADVNADLTTDVTPDLVDMSEVVDMERDAGNPYTEQLEVIDIVEQAYRATCALYERCYTDRFTNVYRTLDNCARGNSKADVLREEVSRLSISREQAEDCLNAWESADCLDVSFGIEIYKKPECLFRGKQKVGESCRYNASCASGFCDQHTSFYFGLLCKERECLPKTKAGDLCTERNYCPPGLYCQNTSSDGVHRCLPLVEPYGTDCRTIDLMRPSCPDAFYCHEDTGECLPHPLEGESCRVHGSWVWCMRASQLSCDEETETCVRVPDEEWFIPDGGGCAFQQDMCLHDSYCKDNTFCTPILQPGDACEEEYDCGPDLFCDENKRCKYRNYEDECRMFEQDREG